LGRGAGGILEYGRYFRSPDSSGTPALFVGFFACRAGVERMAGQVVLNYTQVTASYFFQLIREWLYLRKYCYAHNSNY
jgi:hypothetical protein